MLIPARGELLGVIPRAYRRTNLNYLRGHARANSALYPAHDKTLTLSTLNSSNNTCAKCPASISQIRIKSKARPDGNPCTVKVIRTGTTVYTPTKSVY